MSRMIGAVVATMMLVSAAAASAAPRVVASIGPVHSLVAAVMQGVGTPTLLVRGGASPHTYSLSPSDAKALGQADLVFWIGPGMESFLVKPLATLSGAARVITLAKAPGMTLLDAREGGAWEKPVHENEENAGAEGHHDKNMHLWLDPENAKVMAKTMAAELTKTDPFHAERYYENEANLSGSLDALISDLAEHLEAVKDRPYLVFHDAYPYFEHRFGMRAVGSLTVAPDRPPGAKRVADLRAKIKRDEAVCVFTEPQFQPAIVRTLVTGTGARTGVLDPIGAGIPPGPKAYSTLLRGIADSLIGCLTPAS